MGRMIPPLLLSLQGVHQFSSLPTFPSAAMQCQRWLPARALAQSLTLPQSPGSGEQHENTWPLSRSCCSLPACSRRAGRAGAARRGKGSFALCLRGVIAGQGEKEQKSKPGSSQRLLWGLLAEKSTTKQPTEQTIKKTFSSFPIRQEEPFFPRGSGWIWCLWGVPSPPWTSAWSLGLKSAHFIKKKTHSRCQAWIPLQWQALGHSSELISCASVLASGLPGMPWNCENSQTSPGDTTQTSSPWSAQDLWFTAQFGVCQTKDFTRDPSWAWGPGWNLCQRLIRVHWLRASLGIIPHLVTPLFSRTGGRFEGWVWLWAQNL